MRASPSVWCLNYHRRQIACRGIQAGCGVRLHLGFTDSDPIVTLPHGTRGECRGSSNPPGQCKWGSLALRVLLRLFSGPSLADAVLAPSAPACLSPCLCSLFSLRPRGRVQPHDPPAATLRPLSEGGPQPAAPNVLPEGMWLMSWPPQPTSASALAGPAAARRPSGLARSPGG